MGLFHPNGLLIQKNQRAYINSMKLNMKTNNSAKLSQVVSVMPYKQKPAKMRRLCMAVLLATCLPHHILKHWQTMTRLVVLASGFLLFQHTYTQPWDPGSLCQGSPATSPEIRQCKNTVLSHSRAMEKLKEKPPGRNNVHFH